MENNQPEKMLQTSHLMLLSGNTVLSVLLVAEAIRAGWERWPLVLIIAVGVVAWVIHIRQAMSLNGRTWAFSVMMMGTFFYYGVHPTSLFDMIAIMACMIMLFTMLGRSSLVLFGQLVYYVTMIYNITSYVLTGGSVSSLMISRIVLHVIVMYLLGWFARTIISKRDQVYEEAMIKIDEMTETTERMDEFLANASHELRTPANVVIGLAGVCLDRESKYSESRRDLLAIQDAGRRVSEQISDILDYSELDRGKLVINNEDYSMPDVLADVVRLLRPYMTATVEMVIDVDPTIPAVMNTDVLKLKKVIWHLAMNALKYTNEGGVYIRITTSEQTYGVNLCIDVSDTGIGMNEEEIKNMQDNFYQADSGWTRSVSGLGLGIPIVSGFVGAMGGFFTVESERGKGTTVHVCLPQTVVDNSHTAPLEDPENTAPCMYFKFNKYPIPAVREYYNDLMRHIIKWMGVSARGVDTIEDLKKTLDSHDVSHVFLGTLEYEDDAAYIEKLAERMPVYLIANPGYGISEESNVRVLYKPLYCFPIADALNKGTDEKLPGLRMVCKNINVLVVDDEPLNLLVARGILESYGMIVTTVESGADAVKLCDREYFDIIFMDHMMPDMDGVEAMKQIRSVVRGRMMPVFVALTANTGSEAKWMFRREGFDAFIAKPVELPDLENVLRNLLPSDRITYEEKIINEEPASKDVKSERSFDDLRAYGLDPEVGLDYCQRDEKLYSMLLKDFAENAAKALKHLDQKLEEDNAHDYEIRIHSIKSTSRLIGAMDLGSEAESLEKAAHENRMAAIRRSHRSMAEHYTQLADAILLKIKE